MNPTLRIRKGTLGREKLPKTKSRHGPPEKQHPLSNTTVKNSRKGKERGREKSKETDMASIVPTRKNHQNLTGNKRT